MSPDVLLECPRTSFRDVLRVNVTERVWHSPLYVGEGGGGGEGQLGKNAATPRGHNRLKTPAAGSGNFFVAYGADKHLPRSPNPTSCNMFSFSQDPVDQYFDATFALY